MLTLKEDSFLAVIPARYESTRFPGKALAEISGVPMILRTYNQCLKVIPANQIVVATDDLRIDSYCKSHAINCVMTSNSCLTGTDRVAEIAQKFIRPFYINVQGDEPILAPQDLDLLIHNALEFPMDIFCGCAEIKASSDYFSPSVPKVVKTLDNRLMYISRSAIPGNKSETFGKSWRQICMYSFPRDHLLEFAAYGQKTPNEEIEDIEIIRFLEMGHRVRMIEMSGCSVAVDFPTDIKRVEKILTQRSDM